jgi:sugar lactone lactonase YvrE
MKAEQITGADAEHGEGPVWSPSWGGLRWVDTFDGVLLALAGDGTVTKRHLDRAIGALRPRAGGGMVVALERQFALTGTGDEEPRLLGELWDTPGVQFNDAAPTRRAGSTAVRWRSTTRREPARCTGSTRTAPCRSCCAR